MLYVKNGKVVGCDVRLFGGIVPGIRCSDCQIKCPLAGIRVVKVRE